MKYKEMSLKIFNAVREEFIPKIISSWLIISALRLCVTSKEIDIQLFRETNIVLFALALLVFFAQFTILQKLFPKVGVSQIALIASTTAFSMALCMKQENTYVALACSVVEIIVLIYSYYVNKKIFLNIKNLKLYFIVIIALLFAGFSIGISIYRLKTYSTPNYDFGIFSNMFYHMKTEFLPVVSCERDKFLTHFAIHFSPVFYLLLPFYFIFPSPATLLIGQTVILYSGLVPLYLLMKKHKLQSWTMVLISLVYSAFPTVTLASTYDIHENCFLLPLVLWMIYFYESKKKILFFVFVIAVLSVKEDAFIYPTLFAIYIMLSEKDYKTGGIVIAISVLWFVGASYYINHHGEGIMSSRFSNLKNDDEGLFGVLKTLIFNPGLILKQIFTTKTDTAEKVIYFIQLFFPLAFIPFMSKKSQRFILVAPVLVNLITQYVYQYSVSKQYHFGITAFLFYLTIINLAERKPRKQKFLAMAAAVISVAFAFSAFFPVFDMYKGRYESEKDICNTINSVLETIPKDASVTATAFLVVPMSQRHEVYELEYHDAINTDYLVLDLRSSTNTVINAAGEKYEAAGYKLITKKDNIIAVYKK